MKRAAFTLVTALVLASVAQAAPPPAPPEYVHIASQLLTNAPPAPLAAVMALFADDVRVFENEDETAGGKAALTRMAQAEARLSRKVLMLSEASSGQGGAGQLLVVDVVDTVDRSNLPTTILADPRWRTRAILYQFGADHLIHAVRIVAASGVAHVPATG